MKQIVPIPMFSDNYCWALIDHARQEALVVDPGDADPVLDWLEKSGNRLTMILLTHHHQDHSGGIQKLIPHVANVSVVASHKSPCQGVTQHVHEHDQIKWGDTLLEVVEIPGHTLDHVAYYHSEMLFCGDTLFSAGCGKVFEGTYEQMYHSLDKLAKLPDETKVYCGHEYTLANLAFAKKVEPLNTRIDEKIKAVTSLRDKNIPSLPSSIGIEKQINPFLRCTVSSVIQSAENHVGKKLTNAVEVFACLREWKNSGKL